MTTQNPPNTHYEKAKSSYWIGIFIVYLLMSGVLLLAGMDLHWWQGWTLSIVLFVIGISSRILAERKHPGLMAERGKLGRGQNVKAWDRILAPLMATSITFPLFIVAGLDHHFGWSPAFPVWVNIVGLILAAFGYSFATWAIVENQFFALMMRIQLDRGHKLCDTGPYRFVRHPGYAGNILPLFAIIIALNSVWVVIPAVFALIVTIIRTALEDKALQQELPGYLEYTQKVRFRLIPGIY